MKRLYSALTLADAMHLIPADRIARWEINAPTRPPSATLQDYLRRLRATFDQDSTEAAKLRLIKAALLFVAEAKRDEFVQGRAQCIGEMVACRWKGYGPDCVAASLLA